MMANVLRGKYIGRGGGGLPHVYFFRFSFLLQNQINKKNIRGKESITVIQQYIVSECNSKGSYYIF